MTELTDMTSKDLRDLIAATVADAVRSNSTIVHGMPGLAALLGVSVRQAARIKATGCLDKAISQRGRTIIVNAPLALQLFGTRKH